MARGLGYGDLFGGQISDALGLEAETSDPLQRAGTTGALADVEKYRALRAALGQIERSADDALSNERIVDS